MILLNQSKDLIVADQVREANTFRQRLIGLLGRKELEVGEGLLINPCKIVHTFFMKFAIGLIFLNEDDIVVEVIPSLSPNRISSFVSSATKVIELKADRELKEKVSIGDTINLQ